MFRMILIFLTVYPISIGTCEDFSRQKEMDNKTIVVKEIHFSTPTPTAQEVDSVFNALDLPRHRIDTRNWKEYTYHPDVKFRIAYSPTELYIQYLVSEEDLTAVYGDDVVAAPYKDSCVEMFIIPGIDETYYNLEMNCIGKGTFAGGAKRTDRVRYGTEVLSQIRRYATLGDKPFGTKTYQENNNQKYRWRLTIALPLKLFALSEVPSLKGRSIKANFFKCGDEMPQKQYLSWNPVGSERPNFHTPQYFGTLVFE